MSKARQSITPRTMPARPEASANRELVININQRLLFTVSLVIGALVMLGGGFVVGQLLFRPPAQQAAVASHNPSGLPDALQNMGGAPSNVQVKPAPSDPNAVHPNLEGYVPVSVSAVPVAAKAPRIAISNLDDKATFNMGDIPAGEKREYKFELKNVGQGDLIVEQMYTSCGCTLANFAGRQVTDAPFTPPVVIKPGEVQPLVVAYDSAALNDEGRIDKFIQIFTNDPTGKEIGQPFRETRFRLTGEIIK